ncbi:hypothetical protein [Alcanivorax sp. DP30]|uniref:hypothetical protein n=1 Tax=Alcanivorax sp. DP30 TaxID=2606217 RepID=UPI00136F18FF|nr:hypothetical protein [Alcanivorax sp. DP30]MZR63910.1 hypothetical protein [Alcanivorax sp. DP30]
MYYRNVMRRLVLLLSCLLAQASWSSGPPGEFVDEGVCPFECCEYGRWTAVQSVTVFDQVEGKPVAKLHPDESVDALTGDVYISEPGLVVVRRDYQSPESGRRYQAGDRMYVYTSQGEGFFRVWVDQAWLSEEITFLAGWDSCEEDDSCWGEVVRVPASRWWINVRQDNGQQGWVQDTDVFLGSDACG